jgi:predicted HAD superfamily hydrolase
MDAQWLFEEKRALLKNELSDNLQKKLALELKISKQFEQLKRLEVSMEKTSIYCNRKEQGAAH